LGLSVVYGTAVYPRPDRPPAFQCVGALNALTHELISVTNETYISAE
jgi:hypothetical protein